MSKLRHLDLEDVINRSGASLSREWGLGVRLDQVRLLSKPDRRNLVVRAVAHDENGASRQVIVKATRASDYEPASDEALQASGLVREWVATALISTSSPNGEHGAALLAGDVTGGILVFEDLGDGLSSLVEPLLKGSAIEAETALISYAIALARLHADTVGCVESYRATYQSIFGLGRKGRPLGRRVEPQANIVAKAIGHEPPASELELLSMKLCNPGPWQSLVHGDPCPDNVLLCNGRARLIDYEWAEPSHALLDGAYWLMGFPTCWCAGRMPAAVRARVEAAYRRELARSIPLALDETVYRTELAYISAVWLFTCLAWRLDEALEGDGEWGIASIRGRLLRYLDTAIGITEEADVLPGTRKAARSWLAELSYRWPDATPLSFYPAFASTTSAPAD